MSIATAPTPKVTPQAVHGYLQEMGWDFESRRAKYPTKYKFNKNTREQFKLIVREYARMEEEKDNRQFGSLVDSLARINAGSRVEPRWAEVMKIVSNFLELGEYGAFGCAASLWDSVESPEQRNGYMAQVEDEVRHVTQLGYLSHYFATQYQDPAGFTDFRKYRWGSPFFTPARTTIVDHALSGDPVQMSINLQLVAEAAFTNPLIVAMTETAARQGDEITPTIFLSIESDELRHMANAYQTIVSVVDDADNMKYLQTDIDNAFWINHKFITPFVGLAFDYFSVNKGNEPWARTWDRWVYEDWGGIWLGRLNKFGVKSPASLSDAKKDAYWAHHYAMTAGYALWPLAGIRLETPRKSEYDWFEGHYPGWYDEVGNLFEHWDEDGYADPANSLMGVDIFMDGNIPVYECRVCHLPTIFPTFYDGLKNVRIIEFGGRKHALCSEWCERMYLKEPERYTGQGLFEIFDGWEVSEVVKACGMVRSDGKTCVAQPHLNSERMWTLEDVRKCGIRLRDPLTAGMSFERI